jgi:hypothetical protein
MLALILCVTSVFAKDKGNLPEINEDGLHLVPDSNFEVVYTDPESDLSRYGQIHLLDAYVAFDKNWVRNQGSRNASTRLHATARDLDEIKTALAHEFQTVFLAELQCRGKTLSDQVGEDVLIIRPAIVDLHINAPDFMSARPVRSHSNSAGRMTLYLELVDSVTGKLVSRIVDRKADSERSGLATLTNSATNRAAATRMFRVWAADLSGMLNQQDGMNTGSPGPCSKKP